MLYSGVQDASANTTRFLVLSREPTVCSQDDPRPHKTSLAFALPEGPKRLYEALSVFALRNLDICKVCATCHAFCTFLFENLNVHFRYSFLDIRDLSILYLARYLSDLFHWLPAVMR